MHVNASNIRSNMSNINDLPEEPKTHWMIDTSVLEPVREIAGDPYEIDKEIGNWFSTKEEAEKAVEKLKAWKRLKDKGFKWLWYSSTPAGNSVEFHIYDWDKEATRDITLLFGGEE